MNNVAVNRKQKAMNTKVSVLMNRSANKIQQYHNIFRSTAPQTFEHQTIKKDKMQNSI